jgi:hypothetical protein
VKTAEALYALLHNLLDDFAAAVNVLHPPMLPSMLAGKELQFKITGQTEDLEVREPLLILASARDLRGWLIQQARQKLLEQMVGRTADRVGYTMRKLGSGKWTASISLEAPTEKQMDVIRGGAAEAVAAPNAK